MITRGSVPRVFISPWVIALIFAACHKDPDTQSLAQVEWEKKRAVLAALMSGQPVDEEEVVSSVCFFESMTEVTGIPLRGGIAGYMDFWYPTEDTVTDLDSLDEWYERNKDLLRWDKETGRCFI